MIADKDCSVYFDHDCDGVAFRSAWVSPNDGNLATDGFNALSDFDTNNDGIISNSDENFDKLQIWQDFNSNGISEANELKTLHELGIESLNLNKFPNFNLLVA